MLTQLAVALERIAELAGDFQRICLSATVGNPEEVAKYFAGYRAMQVVNTVSTKAVDIEVLRPKITDKDMNAARGLAVDPSGNSAYTNHTRCREREGKKGTIRIKTDTGRKRIAILGALNIEDLSVIKTLTEERCNAERIIACLQEIKEAYPDVKIVVVLDNARYNYAKATRAFAEESNILLLFLPPI